MQYLVDPNGTLHLRAEHDAGRWLATTPQSQRFLIQKSEKDQTTFFCLERKNKNKEQRSSARKTRTLFFSWARREMGRSGDEERHWRVRYKCPRSCHLWLYLIHLLPGATAVPTPTGGEATRQGARSFSFFH